MIQIFSMKRGDTVLISSQNDNIGTNDHFARGDWGELQDTPFQPGKINKIAMKSIWTTKGAMHVIHTCSCSVMRSAKPGNYLNTFFLS